MTKSILNGPKLKHTPPPFPSPFLSSVCTARNLHVSPQRRCHASPNICLKTQEMDSHDRLMQVKEVTSIRTPVSSQAQILPPLFFFTPPPSPPPRLYLPHLHHTPYLHLTTRPLCGVQLWGLCLSKLSIAFPGMGKGVGHQTKLCILWLTLFVLHWKRVLCNGEATLFRRSGSDLPSTSCTARDTASVMGSWVDGKTRRWEGSWERSFVWRCALLEWRRDGYRVNEIRVLNQWTTGAWLHKSEFLDQQ